MLCCSASAALTASRNESTTRAQSFFEMRGPAVRAICAVTFSTRSDFVIGPPVTAGASPGCKVGGYDRRLLIWRQGLVGIVESVTDRREALERPRGGIGPQKPGIPGA